MAIPLRLALFIDAQNTCQGSRSSLFNDAAPSADGQFHPARVGDLLVARGGPMGLECSLSEVRACTGVLIPEGSRKPRPRLHYLLGREGPIPHEVAVRNIDTLIQEIIPPSANTRRSGMGKGQLSIDG